MHDATGARRQHRLLRFEPFEARIMMSIAPNDPTPQWTADALLIGPQQPTSNPLAVFDQVRAMWGFTGAGQTVAVIDSGIAYTHTSLGAGYGAGYRVVGGWDFAENDANPYDDGPAGAHGTLVAGIIASSHHTHAGAATEVDLVALRVFDDAGVGSFAWIEQSLRWIYDNRHAFENPITTVNLSIGSGWNADNIPSWAMLEEEFALLASEGIFISVAAGNSFTEYNTTGLSYPAASSHVVPVASVNAQGTMSTFSQRNHRVIAAPGQSIVSTVPDYLGNRNGIDDDFQAFSGTSMAAPYVAGTSVLLRQAMEFAGVAFVNQDLLYEVMRSTADVIYDSATNQTYTRLNVMRAIESVMPDDDYGSTLATAHQLGSITDTLSLTGSISWLDDRDYFSFTAQQNGTLSFSLDATHQLAPAWRLFAGSELVATGSDLAWTFDVVAGQSYTLDLGTSAGIGHYALDLSLDANEVDWGVVDFAEFNGLHVSGQHGFTLQAARDGILTIEALFNQTAGSVSFDVYRSDGQWVGSALSTSGGLRFDLLASSGESYIVRAAGQNAHVDFRVTNLVQANQGTLALFGTAGDDTFSFAAGQNFQITINGVHYELDASNFDRVLIDGQAGQDHLTVTGSADTNHVTLAVGSLNIENARYRLDVSGFSSIEVHAGGSSDTATLFDSAGDDQLTATPDHVHLSGAGFENRLVGFADVTVYSRSGNDTAQLIGSGSGDTLTARSGEVLLQGAGYRNTLIGFGAIEVDARGGNNVAHVFDSTGDARFTGSPGRFELASASGTLTAQGFTRVNVTTTAGHNAASLFGSALGDTLIATPQATTFRTALTTFVLSGFQQIQVDGAGGLNQALLIGSTGADTLTARPGLAQFSGAGFNTTVRGFAHVSAFSMGGNDRALLYDSAGDDIFQGTPHAARLFGEGFDHAAFGFNDVRVYSTSGNDRAELTAADGGNTLTLQGSGARLAGSGFNHFAYGFDHVRVDLGSGHLTWQQVEAIDFVYEQVARDLRKTRSP